MSSHSSKPPRLWSLTLGNFAIGTGVMIVPGMLNELSADLGVPPASIGMLISAFAITICVSGPILASLTTAIERRLLLTASLALYALAHLLGALAPGYVGLLGARMLTALVAAVFTSQAAATAGLMVKPEARGQAMGLVFLGWSIAAVFGTPLGAYLGAHIGWRLTMGLVALMSALFALAVWRQIPSRLFVAPMDGAAWKRLAGNAPLLVAVSVTACQAVGMFTVFSYMALVLKDFIGAGPTAISLLFLGFGLAGVTGNVLAARMMDRIGPVRVGMIAMGCMFAALLLWPAAHGSLPLAALLLVLWGLGCFAVNSSQQVRLVAMAPELASASVALNSSAIYLGQASGAFIGGLVLSSFGTSRLSWIGAGFLGSALLISYLASRMAAGRRLAAARS
ncbi:Predicted arabinose efflux permease, MFS family [Noviherbaspirillum humi]|uniref:Predicted arabinose efflux permease, MFS family n=1 Tax=Noviherbaspirillum humi TaxID=1688639 RepID=A0A239C0V0_9BURK|nr:MFS transporter [Noviherbaspirillum humi]SNS13867.1 Predicted arabinose efflux permease, MFS family [Noviherbaspirillum humi]